jgi:hypothetical protein
MGKRVNQSVEIFAGSKYPYLRDEDGEPLDPDCFYYRFPDALDEPIGGFETYAEAVEDFESENPDLIESINPPHFP